MDADLIDQLTSDPDFLKLSEAEQDAMYEELSGMGQSRTAKVEAGIAARRSPITEFRETLSKPETYRDLALPIIPHPILGPLSILKKLRIAGQGVAALEKSVESRMANPLIALMQGRKQDVLKDFVAGLTGERPGERGDVFRQMGAPEMVSKVGGVLTDPLLLGSAPEMIEAAPKVARAIPALARGAKDELLAEGGEALAGLKKFMGIRNRTEAELLTLPEEQLAKLPKLERNAYYAAKNRQTAQALDVKQADFEQQALKLKQSLQQQKESIKGAMPQTAADRIEAMKPSFRNLLGQRSRQYSEGIKTAIDSAEQVSGQPIDFTREQLSEAIGNKFLKSSDPEDVEHYQAIIDLLSKKEIINRDNISARKLLDLADEIYRDVRGGTKGGTQAFTPHELAAQHLRDVLLDLLEQRGIDVRGVKADWAKWVPARKLGYDLQKPSGPGTLIRIAKGTDPVRAEHLQRLETLLGEHLDQETKQLFGQLDAIKQQQIVQQAKKLEFDRLLSGERGFAKDSAAAQKLRIEQKARFKDGLRKLIYAAGISAAGAAGVGTVYKTGQAIGDVLSGQ